MMRSIFVVAIAIAEFARTDENEKEKPKQRLNLRTPILPNYYQANGEYAPLDEVNNGTGGILGSIPLTLGLGCVGTMIRVAPECWLNSSPVPLFMVSMDKVDEASEQRRCKITFLSAVLRAGLGIPALTTLLMNNGTGGVESRHAGTVEATERICSYGGKARSAGVASGPVPPF